MRYDKELEFFVINIRLDSPFPIEFSEVRYSRYAALTETSEHAVWAMEHFPSLARTEVEYAIPIPHSDRWIAVEKADRKGPGDDIYLIVFSASKGKIVRHRFKHVLLRPANDENTVIWWPLHIEGDAALDWLRVHETDKVTRVNTATGEIVPETDASPPFSPAAVDWEKLRRAQLQKPLRP